MYLYEGIEKAEKKMKAVLVGCGEQANNMIHDCIAYIDEIEVVGVCDMNKDRADWAAKRFGLSESYQDLAVMLKKVKADAAFVVTIAGLQAKLAKQCVEAGLHVYTEKPTGTELADVDDLLKAAEEHHKIAAVSFNKRYAYAYHSMKEAMADPAFGYPNAIIAKFIGGYRTNETDLLRVGCCHFFDLARYLIGEPDEVFAYRYEEQPGRHTFAVSVKFENGCVGSFTFGSLGSWINGYGMESVEIRGDRNMLYAENGRDFTWQKPSRIVQSDTGLANKGTQAVTEQAVPVEVTRVNYSNLGKLYTKDFCINGNYQCIKAFADAVLAGTEPEVTARDGRSALVFAMAVEKSVEEHRSVKVSEI